MDPGRRLAEELTRRGLATPARLLADAHRPIAPLLSDLGAALSPLLGATGIRRADDLGAFLQDSDALDRLVAELDAAGGQMDSPAEFIGQLVRLVGELLGASALRFDVGPTLAVLGVLLVFLQLVARPVTRWVTSDPGGLGGVSRAMAVAAEAGTDAVVSLGGAGLVRSSDAFGRLQTLAALPLLGHVARAAARSGVPLRVLTNDPMAAIVASATLEAAHASTVTLERVGRSRVVFVGEGRPAGAGLVMTAQARPAAAFAFGSLREEAQLQLDGLRFGVGTSTAGTAEPAQAPAVLLGGGGLIGPEAYQAAADLRGDVSERTMVLAANRLIGLVIIMIAIGSILALAGVVNPGEILLGPIGA